MLWCPAAEDAAVAAAVSAEATRRAEAVSAPVVICGFGELGQTVANMLDSPAVRSPCGPCAPVGLSRGICLDTKQLGPRA